MDLDSDGQLDVIVASGTAVRIFKSAGTDWASTDIPLTLGGVVGCDAVDVDGDGRLDLVVATGRRGVVLVNDGSLTFHQVDMPSFPEGPQSAFAVASLHVDADGPDLFIVRTPEMGAIEAFLNDGCDCRPDGSIRCGKPNQEYPGGPNVFLHNAGGGKFEVVPSTGTEGDLINLAVGVYDIDGDGRRDLIVGDDSARSHVYRNTGTHQFEDITDDLGLTEHHHGMSVMFGDLLGDGTDQLAFSEIGIPLIMKRQEGKFEQATGLQGFVPYAQWGWGGEMEDFENSGQLDLLFANDPLPPVAFAPSCPDVPFAKLPQAEFLRYRNLGGGQFSAESAVKSTSPLFSSTASFTGDRTLSVADLDGDGVLDALVLPRNDDGTAQPWILLGHQSSPLNGLTVAAPQGAIVKVCADGRCQHRAVGGAHSTSSVHPHEVHFGLGTATEAQVTVEWPKGNVHDLGVAPTGKKLMWKPQRQ